MNYLIIGDIHGHWEILEAGLKYAENNNLKVIQLGDLTDSFSRTTKDQIKCLEIAKDASWDHEFIMGNHDLSYLYPSLYKCSGYTPQKRRLFIDLYEKINFKKYLGLDIENNPILVTHAGLSKKFWSSQDNPDIFELIDYLNTSLKNVRADIYKAGYRSGGSVPVGGIFWCRPAKFKGFDGITQVFGHTPEQTIVHNKKENYWNIDVIEYGSQELLLYQNKEFHVIPRKQYLK